MSTSAIAPSRPLHTGPRLSDEQLKMLKMKLVGLRRLSQSTGFSTSKQVVDLLSHVQTSDLIILGLMFEPVEGKP
ncbi:MAG: hypothetical protein WBQ68_11940 [Terriglobales bacterium]